MRVYSTLSHIRPLRPKEPKNAAKNPNPIIPDQEAFSNMETRK
jgi:hypothetical protein